MERVIALVNKLQEQVENNSPLAYLTATAEMLVTELRQKNTITHVGKVSVFHPTILSPIINRVTIGNQASIVETLVHPVLNEAELPAPSSIATQATHSLTTDLQQLPTETPIAAENIILPPTPVEAPISQPEKIVYTLNVSEDAVLEEVPEAIATNPPPSFEAEHFTPIAPVANQEQTPPIVEKWTTEVPTDKKQSSFLQSAFFMDEQYTNIPTLPIQEPKKEYFELAGNFDNEPSINDTLRNNHQQQEVGSNLQETPLKDLRKGIGINDRFIFINELFRGDEAMYERSLKTINNFSIFPEAEFWIKRELKVKLGWDNSAESVKLFDQLVRRRFS